MTRFFRKRLIYIIGIIAVWEIVARVGVLPSTLFPSQVEIWGRLIGGLKTGELFDATGYSLYLILFGLFIGLSLALLLSTLAIVSKTFDDFLDTLIAIAHPLPGIALLPLAIAWLGIGEKAIIFVIIHATLWPMILNILAGFRSVPVIYREVGENIGLKGSKLVFSIMVPAAFPYLLTGFKIGWARAWRALIAAEMIFGTSGDQGGLGWFIYQQRYLMDLPGVYAALIIIILIGILVEDLVFNFIERKTVKKWGMTV